MKTALAAMLACVALAAHAQAFPTGPIDVVIPLAPGDAGDIAGRAMSQEISKALNAPVIAINRPGAGGEIAAASVAKANNDGQTLLFTQNSALTFRPVLDPQSLHYDPLADFVPLGLTSRTPSVLAVRADAPYKTFAELVEYSKKHPGSVYIGHPGPGSVGDFCVRLINTLSGAGLVPVPFTGAAPGIVALRGGQIQGVVLALGALSPHMKSGTFRGLVSSSSVPGFTAIPTLRQLGYAEDLFGIWFSFLAPAGLAEETKNALVGAIAEAAKSPAIAAKLEPLGIVQTYADPQQQAREMQAEHKRVSEIAAKVGLANN